MRYQKAEDVLPAWLLAQIQEYADGIYLYIPRKAGEKRSWGNGTRYKEELRQRNASIRQLRRAGTSVSDLAQQFHLSVKSIQRILRQAD